jgi:hypothetical protein
VVRAREAEVAAEQPEEDRERGEEDAELEGDRDERRGAVRRAVADVERPGDRCDVKLEQVARDGAGDAADERDERDGRALQPERLVGAVERVR